MNRPKSGHRSKSRGRSSRAHCNDRHDTSDILQPMFAFINSTPNGCTTIKNLQQRFKLSEAELWSFVKINQAHFLIQERSISEEALSGCEQVWVKTDLRLCEKHCRRGKNCSGNCGNLHLCRNFLLLGDMCCQFHKLGKFCDFGHDFKTQHNGNLLNTHKLSLLLEGELRALFRRRHCRSVSTMPQICIYYNGKDGKRCSNKRCKSLHICLDFVLERCTGRCGKSHSMDDQQVAFTLDLFAIDKSWPDNAVIEDLRAIMKRRIHETTESDTSSMVGDIEIDSSDDSETDLKAAGGQFHEKVEDKHGICCSHCEEIRAELKEMTKTIQILRLELQGLKDSRSMMEDAPIFDDNDDGHKSRSPDQKQMLGMMLYSSIKEIQPKFAKKITCLFMSYDNSYILDLLKQKEVFQNHVEQAVVLIQHANETTSNE